MSRRPAVSTDEPFIQALLKQIVSDELGAGAWPEALRDSILEMQYRARRQGIRSAHPGAEEEILLAGGEAAGWTVIDRTKDEIRLVEIAVAPSHRGQRLATQRILDLLEEADGARTPVRLSVLRENPAQRLYERLGFRPSAEDGVRIYMERTAGDRRAEHAI